MTDYIASYGIVWESRAVNIPARTVTDKVDIHIGIVVAKGVHSLNEAFGAMNQMVRDRVGSEPEIKIGRISILDGNIIDPEERQVGEK